MNRKDLPLLLVLFGLLMAWPMIDRQINEKFLGGKKASPTEAVTPEAVDAAAAEPADRVVQEPSLVSPSRAAGEEIPAQEVSEPQPATEEVLEVLENDNLAITFSSYGATARRAVVKKYKQTLDEDSGAVELAFEDAPALAYFGLPGLGQAGDFQVSREGDALVFRRTAPSGLRLERTVRLSGNYTMAVRDVLVNGADVPAVLTNRMLQVGGMSRVAAHQARGLNYLGVDVLLEGADVKHWANKIPRWLKSAGKNSELDAEGTLSRDLNTGAFWIGTKNRFFLQVLFSKAGFEGVDLRARGIPAESKVTQVFAQAELGPLELGAGESYVQEFDYYLGPKRFSELKKVGQHLYEVLELGWFGIFGRFLLRVMNFIHDNLWPYNYGIAVMLLTIIIRVIFWPLTHKGTENMKKMQKLQPLMKEIQAKYKAGPNDSDKVKREKMAKQQQAIMAMYREHKVNPMMGCLPMVVQIPVFISLFYVLRSSIELRYAKFLWITDLSDAERLIDFGFRLPLIGWDALNLLPLFMAGTTVLQMKTAPQTGDPAQRKLFMFMPLIMLLFLYDFPAGLMLYWCTNNVLMIIQQWWQRRRQDDGAKA